MKGTVFGRAVDRATAKVSRAVTRQPMVDRDFDALDEWGKRLRREDDADARTDAPDEEPAGWAQP